MSGKRNGISVSDITWAKDESEIAFNETGSVDIEVVGYVGVSDSPTSLDDAIQLLPSTIPLSDDGPIGNCTRYDGAGLKTKTAAYMGDDTIKVSAKYEIAVPDNQAQYPGEEGDESDSDRAQRTIATEDAPLLTHPIVQQFPTTDRRLLASLLSGEIRVNPRYDAAGSDRQLWEFIRDTEDGEDIEKVQFSDSDVTYDQITASPLDYARLLASGVDTWRRPTIRHTLTKSRNTPATNAEYGKVGEVIASTPALAPELTGSGQWFLGGITDSTSNGETWITNYEFERTGAGGALAAIYKGGSLDIA